MGEPQLSEAAESDRRSAPRFPADLLGKASVRLLGGSEVTLINFSERGILFQSETRLLVGARGTVRIVVGTETTIAAGTVVRSLVQGMASGKLAFHTALVLDQPLAMAVAVATRERAKAAAVAPAPAPVDIPPIYAEPIDLEPVALEPAASAAADLEPVPLEPATLEAVGLEPSDTVRAEAPRSGKTIEKRSRKASTAHPTAPAAPEPEPFVHEPIVEPIVQALAEAETPAFAVAAVVEAPAALEPPLGGGFGDNGSDSGFGGGSFGWTDAAAETSPAGLSVLFISTTKERTSRLHGILAGHRRDIALTTVMQTTPEAIADIGRQHDVLLFDFAIGPEALERTLSALRASPLGASIAIFVPQQTALPPAVSSLANACVIDTASGNMLAAALRDAAWTPWQPVEAAESDDGSRDDLFWKAFDALPVPVLVVDPAGTILHANGACTKLVDGVELVSRPLASFFVTDDGPAIAKLIADGLAGGYEDTPVFTAPADGATVQIVLQALSVLPGAGDRPQLALRCERRAEPIAAEATADAPDLATEFATLAAAHDELAELADASRTELARVCGELEAVRVQVNTARRERDELRGQLEIAQRDLERARELERAGAAKIVELERALADAARMESAVARAQAQYAAGTEELSTLRTEFDALRLRTTSQGAEAERAAVRYAAIETSARQADEELKIARGDVQRLTRERDQAVAAAAAERARAEAAVIAAREGARDANRDEAKTSRKIVVDDAAALTNARLQRQIDELRAEVKQEQDARKELEDLLDQNAENLEQTIQDYEAKLDALNAGAEDKRPAAKPKKTRQG